MVRLLFTDSVTLLSYSFGIMQWSFMQYVHQQFKKIIFPVIVPEFCFLNMEVERAAV